MMGTTDMTAAEIEKLLAEVPIFSHLGPRDIKKLAKLCVPRAFSAGETVIEEGAVGLGMFVVISGRVEVFKRSNGGQIPLGAMTDGEVLGEIALVDDQPRSASAVAASDTECLLLTRDSFETLVKTEPEIAWCVVPGLAERIRELHQRAVTAEERLRAAEQGAPSRPRGEKAESPPEGDAEDSSDDESEAWETVAKFMRMQYGLMLGGVTGMTGMAKVCETFFKKLADETDVADDDSMSDFMEKAPDGFVEASRKAMSQLEDLPQEMVDSFRSVYKND